MKANINYIIFITGLLAVILQCFEIQKQIKSWQGFIESDISSLAQFTLTRSFIGWLSFGFVILTLVLLNKYSKQNMVGKGYRKLGGVLATFAFLISLVPIIYMTIT